MTQVKSKSRTTIETQAKSVIDATTKARLLKISESRKSWKNIIHNQAADPIRYFEPENVQDLIAIIQDAESKNLRVRAVGSGFSFSDVALTSDYMVYPGKMNQVREIAHCSLKVGTLINKKYPKEWVEIEAGITIHDLNRELDRKMGCALTNMGAVDKQTFSGAVATGTHGTGLNLHALPGMIKSMVIVTTGGKVMRIEPKDGITDPIAFKKHNKSLDYPIELKQDDDFFYACLVNLGCMGIIYSYIIEVEKMYWLSESKTLMTWAEVKKKLKSGEWFQKNSRLSVQVNPYKVKKKGQEQYDCIVISHEKFSYKPKRSIGDRVRNLLTLFGGLPSFPALTILYMNLRPHRIPAILRNGIRAQRDRHYINKSYKVLHQGNTRLKLQGVATEFSFRLNADLIIEAVEKVFDIAENLQKEGGIYQTAPISLRFVKESEAYISTEYHQHSCHIDLPNLAKTKGAMDLLDRYQITMLELGGKPHWGKVINRLSGYLHLLPEMYPKLWNWLDVFGELNHKGTFNNVFTDRMGFSGKVQFEKDFIFGKLQNKPKSKPKKPSY